MPVSYSIQRLVISYCVMLLCFAVLDGVWLGVVASDWYFGSLSELMREQFVTWPWLVFYLAYCVATLYLAVLPAYPHCARAFVKGGVVGATAYGTYNLTNYAIIANWPLAITLTDWLWGTFVTAMVSASGAKALTLKH